MLVERALLVARACSLAFLPPYAIPYSPYATDLRCIGQVEDPQSLSGATILACPDDEVIIACRGSSNIRNFRTNFDIGPVPLETSDGDRIQLGGQVHSGFQKAAQQLWQQVEPQLPPTGRLTVTGHSLGGGTATLLALYARARGMDTSLVTVAGPRLGTKAFAAYFRESCGEGSAVHLLHDADDVIRSNKQLWDNLGFEHVGRVVQCDKDAPCIYEDSEAVCLMGDASDGPPSLRGVLVDHCMYMGVYIGLRAKHPGVWLRPP